MTGLISQSCVVPIVNHYLADQYTRVPIFRMAKFSSYEGSTGGWAELVSIQIAEIGD